MENEKNTEIMTEGVGAKTKSTPAIFKKWWFWLIIGIVAISLIAGTGNIGNQGDGSASPSGSSSLGNYDIVIESCRLAEDFEGKSVVIVKYKFTNNDDEPIAFFTALDDNVYQNGVGLNGSYVLDESANYSADNQTKAIKKGSSIEVEVAYELNDTTTPIEVEVSELFSFSDKKITKTFTID